MLEAIAGGKASMTRLMGRPGRQPREDMVTSALFGPLRMMTPRDRARALSALLGVPLSDATTVEVKLWWPKGRGRQTDVLIQATRGGDAVRVLVEVKWGAPLSENQLVDYAELVRTRHGRPPDNVVLLGYEQHHEVAVETQETTLGREVVRRRWREAARALRDEARRETGQAGAVEVWADQVFRFLQRTGKGHLFAGFEGLGIRSPGRGAISYRAAGSPPWFARPLERPRTAAHSFRRRETR